VLGSAAVRGSSGFALSLQPVQDLFSYLVVPCSGMSIPLKLGVGYHQFHARWCTAGAWLIVGEVVSQAQIRNTLFFIASSIDDFANNIFIWLI